MNDINGKSLSVGDKVVFAVSWGNHQAKLRLGTVERLGVTMVDVRSDKGRLLTRFQLEVAAIPS